MVLYRRESTHLQYVFSFSGKIQSVGLEFNPTVVNTDPRGFDLLASFCDNIIRAVRLYFNPTVC